MSDNPLLAPNLSREELRACKAELDEDQIGMLASDDEARLLTDAEAKITYVAKAWPAAVENAKRMPEGGLRSAWEMPVELLAAQLEDAIRTSGGDPDKMPTPDCKPDKHEEALPNYLRQTYRRGAYLLKRGPKVCAKAKAAHKKRAAKIGRT